MRKTTLHSGYTDALVLEVPELWWPSLGDLAQHPLHHNRSFCSAVSSASVSHPVAVESAHPSVGLSRLGRSVFLKAEWIMGDAHDKDEPVRVRVWNPFSSQFLELAIVPPARTKSIPLRAQLASSAGPLLSVAELVANNQLRLVPRSMTQKLPVTAPSRLPSTCVERQLAALTERHAKSVVASCQSFLERAASGRVMSPVHAVLVEGCTGSGKAAVLDHVLRLVPATYTVTPSAQQGCLYVMEYRTVDCADLLCMDTREAIKTVQTVLRPPPLAQQTPAPSSTKAREPVAALAVRPVMVVTLRHVELLWEFSNDVSSAVIYQLCASLDAMALDGGASLSDEDDLAEGRAPRLSAVTLLLSTASDTSRVPPALLRRVMMERVVLGTTTAAERVACLRCLFPDSSASDAIKPTPRSLERVAETLSSSTIAALLQVTPDHVRQRAAALAEEEHGSSCYHTSGHGVGPYGHLFGIDDVVAALERLLVWPLTHLTELRRLHIPCAKGAILYGPSGSGKTAVMRALAERVARGADTRWLTSVQLVDGLTLVEKEVGRSEKNIAAMFNAARAAAPTVLLIDNLEALAPPRGRQSNETTTSSDRTLSTLLTEMDGVTGDREQNVFVVACAPSPEFLDAAVRRPGRLDIHLHLTAPTRDIVLDAMTAHLLAVVRHLCPSNASGATREDHAALLDIIRSRLEAAMSRSGSTFGEKRSAAAVSGYLREVTLKVIREAVGDAEESPAEGLPLESVLQALDAALGMEP